jgi:hypothetical protein
MFVKFEVYNEPNSAHFLFCKHCSFPVSLISISDTVVFRLLAKFVYLGVVVLEIGT